MNDTQQIERTIRKSAWWLALLMFILAQWVMLEGEADMKRVCIGEKVEVVENVQ